MTLVFDVHRLLEIYANDLYSYLSYGASVVLSIRDIKMFMSISSIKSVEKCFLM